MNEPCDGVRSIRAPGHYEWWYFDFEAGEQGLARIEWHAPLFSLQDENCVLVLRHYDQQRAGPDKKGSPVVRGARYPRSRVEMESRRCRILFPAGSITEEAGDYRIEIAEKDFAADLQLTRLLPPVTSPDGEIIGAAGGNEAFCWSIPLPRAHAAGTITLDGEEYPVDGPAYHDHNWGNLHLGRRLHRWVWLRVPFENLTLIFARIELRGAEEPVHRLVALDGAGQLIDAAPLEVELEGEKPSACSRLRLPAAIRIRFGRETEYRAGLEVSGINAVEEEPLGAFASGWINTLYARLWYFAGSRRLPRLVRQRAGRLLFLQAAVAAELTRGGGAAERAQGVLEVFHCGS